MDRFKYCTVKVDANKVKRLIMFFYGSLTAYCLQNGITRTRLYFILNKPHSSKDAKCLQDLAKNLKTSIGDILE